MDLFVIFLATKLYMFVIAIGAAVYLWSSRLGRARLRNVSILALPLAFVISRIANALFENPRPFVDGHMTALIAHAPDNGFPSDHTLLTVTIGAIVYTHNKLAGLILIGLGILVGTGRVLAGVHHIIDIVGSVVIAFFATYVAVYALRTFCAPAANVRD